MAASVVELLVQEIAATSKKKLLKSVTGEEFELTTTNSGATGMLLYENSRSHRTHAQIQRLPSVGSGGNSSNSKQFARVGTVGDGNCLLHAILFALSPTYRSFNKAARSHIADRFRTVLVDQIETLRAFADVTFFDIGGAEALEEDFAILVGKREEINIELAPLIAQLYGFNLLAVKLKPHTFAFRPVCVTFMAYNPALPTILVNYIGGGLDFGDAAAGESFQENGHYEAIFRPVFAKPVPIRLVVSAAAAGAAAAVGGAGTGVAAVNLSSRTTDGFASSAPAGAAGPRRSTRTTVKASRPISTDLVPVDLARSQFTFRHDEIPEIIALFEDAVCEDLAAGASPPATIATHLPVQPPRSPVPRSPVLTTATTFREPNVMNIFTRAFNRLNLKNRTEPKESKETKTTRAATRKSPRLEAKAKAKDKE